MGARDAIAKLLTGIKAFHSSPHDFDRFDLSKIGTGEGAQVYGHGLYFAENPAVSGQGGQYWNQFANKFRGPESSAANIMKINNFDRDAAIEHARRALAKEEEALRVGQYVPGNPDTAMSAEQMSWHPALIAEQQEVLRMLESGQPVGPRTYEVNIKADPAQFLDWDKPLRTQSPQVQEAARLLNVPPGTQNYYEGIGLRPTTGKEAYRYVSDDPVRATQMLNEAGVPGIKYLDEGSRNARPALTTTPAGDVISSAYPPPTSNYVVFDPGIVDIMKKYGVVGASAGALGAAYDQGQYEVAQ
jgi:hypothetical protein